MSWDLNKGSIPYIIIYILSKIFCSFTKFLGVIFIKWKLQAIVMPLQKESSNENGLKLENQLLVNTCNVSAINQSIYLTYDGLVHKLTFPVTE